MIKKRWLFFKLICIIDITVVALLICCILYQIIQKDTENNVSGNLVFFLVCSIFFIADTLDIKLVNKFNTHQGLSKRFNILLIIFYILSCLLLLVVASAIYSFSDIIDWRAGNFNYDYYNRALIIVACLIFVLFFTSLVKVIFTLIIKSSLKKSNKAFVDSIEGMGTATT